MRELNEDDYKDGKPSAKNPPNNTTTADTLSPKQRYFSFIQRNEAKFCDGYDSDGNSGPFVPKRIVVKTVEKDKDIVPILEAPPMAVTVMFPDTVTDSTKGSSKQY